MNEKSHQNGSEALSKTGGSQLWLETHCCGVNGRGRQAENWQDWIAFGKEATGKDDLQLRWVPMIETVYSDMQNEERQASAVATTQET